MEKEAFSFILENLNKLEGFDIFLVFIVSLVISVCIFLVFKWLYQGILTNQKELIDAKEKLSDHYRQLYNELKETLNGQVIKKDNQKESKNEPGKVSPLFSEIGYLLVFGSAVKMHSSFYILQSVNILKNGLWAVALKSKSEELLLKAQDYLDELDKIAFQMKQVTEVIVSSIDIQQHKDWEEQFVSMENARKIDLSKAKEVLLSAKVFVEKEL